ncbi:GNAT family N-acetyltransferase [Bdellovibrio sp. HCB2-146]|uniref:GNAT family N-acetyltransferase n=1 Tax=Bdellovibrio sp. HCB2-146 TaxID=3394362 RepID=UPI0039BD3175
MLDLEIVSDRSTPEFLQECGPLLYQAEPVNSLMIGLLEGMVTNPTKDAPVLLRIVENGKTVSGAVCFRANPMNLIITYATARQLRLLCQHMIDTKEVFSGVVGPRFESETFATIWSELTGKKFDLGMAQKIYKLESVIFPHRMNGTMKVATPADADFVFGWMKAFAEESLPNDKRTDEQWKEFADRIIQRQGVHLWLVDDKPVAMALFSRPTQNGISVSGVYTPPANRKKGYASAVVASLSQKALDQGKKFCVLYTDIKNPTSNKIYQEIGYQEVCESRHFNFL